MYLVELIWPSRRNIGRERLALLMPHTITEPIEYSSVDTVQLDLYSASFLWITCCVQLLLQLLKLLSSVNSTFNQYEKSWSSLYLTKFKWSFYSNRYHWLEPGNIASLLEFLQSVLNSRNGVFFKQNYTVFTFGKTCKICFWDCEFLWPCSSL